jgi:hypothetical protein
MPRYVILRHELPPHTRRPTHWDLMFETHGVLATWALDALPAAGKKVAAERLADHRLDYLDFEGPVSGDRGTVLRWDAGQYRVESQSSVAWHVAVRGDRLDGQLRLEAVADEPRRWTVSYSAAEHAC